MNKENENILNVDMAEIADAWKNMSSSERETLENSFRSYGDKDKATFDVLQKWDTEFNAPRKVVEVKSDRDVYSALKNVYDNTNSLEEVVKVASYNGVPKETLDTFIKDNKFVEELPVRGEEKLGAIARGALGGLYGGFLNDLTGGAYSKKYTDVVPEGVEYDDMAKTLWRSGVRQSEGYGKALGATNPSQEVVGNIIGSVAPLGLAGTATKGIKAAKGAGAIKRTLTAGLRGGATGALYSVPESLSKENVGDALENTLRDAATFAIADSALTGLGATLGAVGRGTSRIAKTVSTPGEHLTKAFPKLKAVEDMSKEEIERGMKAGWLTKDKKLNVTEYLAKEHGMNATETMENLAKLAKGNREVYNQLKSELKNFNYREALDKAAQDAIIPNAPLSRFNQVMKALPERLAKFSDDIIGFTEEEGINLAQTMRAFNQQIKHELRSIVRPNAKELRAMEKYLKDVETANMKQFMLKKLPSELNAIDKTKTLGSEFGRIFQITNPASAFKAISNVAQDQMERNYIRQIMAGEKYRAESPVTRLLQQIGKKAQ